MLSEFKVQGLGVWALRFRGHTGPPNLAVMKGNEGRRWATFEAFGGAGSETSV